MGAIVDKPKGYKDLRQGSPEPSRALVPIIPKAPTDIDRARPELVEGVKEALKATRSGPTRDLYEKGWQKFREWCAKEGFKHLPASPQAVAMYLSWLAQHGEPQRGRRKGKKGYSAAFLNLARSSIAFVHRQSELPSPTVDVLVRETMRGLMRSLKDAEPREARPLLPFHLKAMISWLEKKRKARIRFLRDRAILLGSFIEAARRGETAAHRRRDVKITKKGVFFEIRGHQGGRTSEVLKGAKTAQGGKQSVDWRDEGDLKKWGLDPVRALWQWRQASGGHDDDFFYRRITRGVVERTPISSRKVDRLVKECAKAVGLESAHYGAHSLRAGFATYSIYVLNRNRFAVKKHMRHESIDMLDKYVRKWDELPKKETL